MSASPKITKSERAVRRFVDLRLIGFTLAMGFSTALVSGLAQAQLGSYADGAVSIDLSAIPGGGYADQSGGQAGISAPLGGGLLAPGPNVPSSTLYITPTNNPSVRQLRRPQTTTSAPRYTDRDRNAEMPPVASAPRKIVRSSPVQVMPPAEKQVPAAKAPAPLKAAPPPPEPSVAEAPPAPPMEPAKSPPPPPAMAAPPPPPPPPPTAAIPAPTPPPPQPDNMASLTPGSDGQLMRVLFDESQSKLPDSARANLAKLADQVKDKRDVRLQLLAYAGGADLNSNRARRLSLSRALSVRSFLIESGIRSTRIDVRALGDKTAGDPKNRVDVTLAAR